MNVKDMWDTIRVFLAVVGGFLSRFLGGMDGMVMALIWFAAIDYTTGIIAAIIEKKLDSSIGWKGILKKFVMFMIVGICHIVDADVLGGGSALRTMAIIFYISNEGVSVVENVSRAGLPVPNKLKEVLAQLKEDSERE